jgi:hypothetical protein
MNAQVNAGQMQIIDQVKRHFDAPVRAGTKLNQSLCWRKPMRFRLWN